MTHSVTSKFSITFWINAVIFTLFVFGSMLACAIIAISYRDNYSKGQLSSIAVLSVVLVIVYVYSSINSLRSITASPDGLIIKYLLTKKQIIIDYADITHVGNMRAGAENAGNFPADHVQLEIELSTGEELKLLKEDIAYYDELKEAIRRYRFHLP